MSRHALDIPVPARTLHFTCYSSATQAIAMMRASIGLDNFLFRQTEAECLCQHWQGCALRHHQNKHGFAELGISWMVNWWQRILITPIQVPWCIRLRPRCPPVESLANGAFLSRIEARRWSPGAKTAHRFRPLCHSHSSHTSECSCCDAAEQGVRSEEKSGRCKGPKDINESCRAPGCSY